MIQNRSQSKFATKLKLVAWNAMLEGHVACGSSDQRWQNKLQFSIWSFFEQSAFVNNYSLCYWPTIHNSISKICPKFQVLSSHFFKVDELCSNQQLNEYWVKIVQSESISTPIYVQCDKMYSSKVCVQEFWFFVPGFDIQPEQSENNNPALKNAIEGCEIQWVI